MNKYLLTETLKIFYENARKLNDETLMMKLFSFDFPYYPLWRRVFEMHGIYVETTILGRCVDQMYGINRLTERYNEPIIYNSDNESEEEEEESEFIDQDLREWRIFHSTNTEVASFELPSLQCIMNNASSNSQSNTEQIYEIENRSTTTPTPTLPIRPTRRIRTRSQANLP